MTSEPDTQYQGHLADGSSVQKHSAGGLYPYILFAKQAGSALAWGILEPTGVEHMFSTHGQALECGLRRKRLDAVLGLTGTEDLSR